MKCQPFLFSMNPVFRHLLITSLFVPCFATAAEQGTDIAGKDWGIAVGIRTAKIPYATKEDQVQDFIPLMFYDGDTFFIRGLTGGVKLYHKEQWQFSLIGRYRYFDIPADFQNLAQGNALDVGGQLKYRFDDKLETSFEIMLDDDSRAHSSLDTRYHWESGAWDIFPYATLRFKSAKFNNYYYGLDGFISPAPLTTTPPATLPAGTINNKIGSGFDLTLGSEVRYHVASNFYLLGRLQITTLDSNTRNSGNIKSGTYGEIYAGIAFFNDKSRTKASALKARPYIRVAHGWATPSNLSDITSFNWEDDAQDNQMTSIFYGHPIADSLFGIDPVDVYITTGFIYHHSAEPYQQTLPPGQGINTSELSKLSQNPCDGSTDCTLTYQSQPTREYVLGIKAYYNIHWPVHWRFGLAEGLSYIETVSNIEQREMDRKGYRSSKLMNYIDVTFDVSLGDLFAINKMQNLYLGVGVHHRSSIFESSSAFGRIKGGSNYNSIYLQYHF